MKKLQIVLGLGAISALFLLNSCTETTNPAPVIDYDQASPIVLGTGVDETTLTGTIDAEAGLDEVRIYKIVGTSETLEETITSFASGIITTTDDINYAFRYDATGITAETTIKLTAVDKDDQEVSESIIIQVTEGSINSYTAVLLGAQSNDAPSALDAYNGVRYSFDDSNPDFDYAPDHKADIDIIYYYGSSNLATLAAPADPSLDGSGTNAFDWTNGWSPKNATVFGSTALDFDDVNFADLAGISGLTDTKETELDVDDVIAFETVDGEKGLIKVTNLTTGASGTITIHVKIQE